jgi:serine/threonine protein kinase
MSIQVLKGVGELHAKKVIHKDLKPANVLVFRSPDGKPVVKVCAILASTHGKRQNGQHASR